MARRGGELPQQRLDPMIELIDLSQQVVLLGIEFVEQGIVRSDLC